MKHSLLGSGIIKVALWGGHFQQSCVVISKITEGAGDCNHGAYAVPMQSMRPLGSCTDFRAALHPDHTVQPTIRRVRARQLCATILKDKRTAAHVDALQQPDRGEDGDGE